MQEGSLFSRRLIFKGTGSNKFKGRESGTISEERESSDEKISPGEFRV